MKDDLKIFLKVVHTKLNSEGYKEQGITYPSADDQKQLLEEFYEECEIDPATVDFVEAHGTGNKITSRFYHQSS